jgi:hypothetical protein
LDTAHAVTEDGPVMAVGYFVLFMAPAAALFLSACRLFPDDLIMTARVIISILLGRVWF